MGTNARMGAVWGLLVACAASCPAGTTTWTDADADHNLPHAGNWNPAASPFAYHADWVFDDTSPAGSTQGVWGAGTPAYPHVYTITFNKAGGFDMGGKSVWVDGNALTVSKPNSTAVVGYVSTTSPMLDVATNSVLYVQDYFISGDTWVKAGPGVVRMANRGRKDGGGWDIREGAVEVLVAPGGYRVVVDGLKGAGEFRVLGGSQAYVAVKTNGFALAGRITVRSPDAGRYSWLDLETDGETPWTNVEVCIESNAALFAGTFPDNSDAPDFTNLILEASVLSGGGAVCMYKSFTYGPAFTLTARGSQITPTPGSGPLGVIGNLAFARSGATDARLRLGVLATGSGAGASFGQLAVTPLKSGAGGSVSSGSDPDNPLADCDLVVDLSSLAPGTTLSGQTNVILSCTNDLTDAAFANVSFVNGTGTLIHAAGGVFLADVRVEPPAGFAWVDNTGGATGVRAARATLHGSLLDTGGSPTSVRVVWDTVDRGTNGTWNGGHEFGLCTPSNLAFEAAGLASNTVCFYTYCASNAAGLWWAQPSVRFVTTAAPLVTTGSGATNVYVDSATLNGWLTNAPYASVTVYWGVNELRCDHTNALGPLSAGAFALDVEGLRRSTTYKYRCFATNDEAGAWSAAASFTTPAESPPELPREYVDVSYAPPTGGTLRAVSTAAAFRDALTAAVPGDIIELQAGAEFEGGFEFPQTSGSGWIYVRSSAYAQLPPPGTRVQPSQAPLMPRIVTRTAALPALASRFGAHHWRFVGIEFASEADPMYNLIFLGYQSGAAATTIEQLPHHIIFDRCYVHGTPTNNLIRGITLNSAYSAVVDCYVSDCHAEGFDSQAIGLWNGSGPFAIINNEIEGAAENLMFGGADPSIPNLVPSDIEIRRNHFLKPRSWKIDDPTYAGIPWTVKNLLEFKNARRVLVEGNVFEQHWPHAQSGWAIVVTVRNQDGTAPWCDVRDLTYRLNILREASDGINMLATDYNHPSRQTKRVRVENCLFDMRHSLDWGGAGSVYQMLGSTQGLESVSIEHDTALNPDGILVPVETVAPHTNFVFRNCIGGSGGPWNLCFFGSGLPDGNVTLETMFVEPVVTNNVLPRAWAPNYSHFPGNFFPAGDLNVGFMDYSNSNFRLAASSPYKGAGTDGLDIGANIDALEAATRGCVTGDWRVKATGSMVIIR